MKQIIWNVKCCSVDGLQYNNSVVSICIFEDAFRQLGHIQICNIGPIETLTVDVLG